MILQDIIKVRNDEKLNQEYTDIYNNLKKKYANEFGKFDRKQLFEECKSSSQYARNVYRGKLKPGIQLTELELSMILDNGFSHFGGTSSIGSDGNFTVNIYID